MSGKTKKAKKPRITLEEAMSALDLKLEAEKSKAEELANFQSEFLYGNSDHVSEESTRSGDGALKSMDVPDLDTPEQQMEFLSALAGGLACLGYINAAKGCWKLDSIIEGETSPDIIELKRLVSQKKQSIVDGGTRKYDAELKIYEEAAGKYLSRRVDILLKQRQRATLSGDHGLVTELYQAWMNGKDEFKDALTQLKNEAKVPCASDKRLSKLIKKAMDDKGLKPKAGRMADSC